ncbi:MAG: radical SAM protein [Promethearchaeota archaeon]
MRLEGARGEYPDSIRVSIGSAVKLGLADIKMDVEPTNCYLLTYHKGGCLGNCAFCPQSRYTMGQVEQHPESQKYLSRISWPKYNFKDVLNSLKERYPKYSRKGFQRICIQSLYYKDDYGDFEVDLERIIRAIKKVTQVPISMAIPPVSIEKIRLFKELGAERVCFALDAATPQLFDEIKGVQAGGPYIWDSHIKLLKESLSIFGNGYVTTHLIVGLGETEKEAIEFIYKLRRMHVLTGLFAFYPIKYTKFENRNRPDLISYRKIQLAKFLIDSGRAGLEEFSFDHEGALISFPITKREFQELLKVDAIFMTSGCPGCNRPYYTSSPHEEQYNYPRHLTPSEKNKILEELRNFFKRE